MLLLLSLLSFLTGPLLFSPDQHHSHSVDQDKSYQHIHGNDTKPILEKANQHIDGNDTKSGLGVIKRSSKSIWASKTSQHYYGCSEPRKSFSTQLSKSHSTGYLIVEASGGLNQQRTGIVDAVVVARMLNATLVVPRLDHASFWKDSSNFSEIFSVDQFITALKPYVRIVKELPRSMKERENKIPRVRTPRKSTPDYYKRKILPMLLKNKVICLTKFDYRLANRLDEDLQKLRCKVNYHALQYTEAIKTMGDMLVKRLRQRNGPYIALHLRFEPDMLAFTGCYYGGGEKEIKELGLLRKRWKSIPHRNPEKARRNGRCPLTPEEVGFMLHALGYRNDSYLYVASGEIYDGERSLAPLKKMFPKFCTKDTLASREELQAFSAYSSRLAAIDFIVCDESDAFVTNNNGNMARMLAGRRRYFGHKRTIRSNAKKLGSLFLAKPNMTRDAFAFRLKKFQKGLMGEPMEMRPGRGQFFENPSACICQAETEKLTTRDIQEPSHVNAHNKEEVISIGDDSDDEENHIDSVDELDDIENQIDSVDKLDKNEDQDDTQMDELSSHGSRQTHQENGSKDEYTEREEYSSLAE